MILLLSVSLAVARIVYRGTVAKELALTFDDGPEPGFTDKILRILKEQNVPATFFVEGRKAIKEPGLLKQMVAGGNEMGNHTYAHSRLTQNSDAQLLKELKLTAAAIKTATGRPVRFFRPPFGHLTGHTRRLIERSGYDLVMWSANGDDYYKKGKGIRRAESIARRINSQVQGGNIILLHDDNQQTVAALPMIIKQLKARGFYFVTLAKFHGQYYGKPSAAGQNSQPDN